MGGALPLILTPAQAHWPLKTRTGQGGASPMRCWAPVPAQNKGGKAFPPHQQPAWRISQRDPGLTIATSSQNTPAGQLERRFQ